MQTGKLRMDGKEPIRNVGIVAHVDAGKTTTTEHMLYVSGRIRQVGRVDNGTAQTDWLDVERERGISVRAATTVIPWLDTRINLIDTPGHVDFAAEVERVLRVLDGVILIVSAVEGVQAHTETLWHALRDMQIPTLIFINKLDRVGADSSRVMAEIERVLTDRAAAVQIGSGLEKDFSGVLSIWGDNLDDVAGQTRTVDAALATEREDARMRLIEKLADCDEDVLAKYINGEPLNDAWLKDRLVDAVSHAKLYPVLFGAANRGIGVRPLLHAITELLPAPKGNPEGDVSGIVFKLERDKVMGRLAYVRLYEGTLRNRDVVRNDSQGTQEKVSQIRKMHAQSYEDVGVLTAGDIAAVCGLGRVKIGDVIGCANAVPLEHRMAVPLLTVQAHATQESDYMGLVAALQELTDEDPMLDFQWHQDERELHVKVMGTIQLEILTALLRTRFGIEASFGEPMIIYKETPTKSGEGFVAYTMPKPCWAILRFLIEPAQRGSGLVYDARVRTEDLLAQYQNEVARRVPEALSQGLRGWEVTDLKVTLIEGQHHVWHTHPLDFVVATPMGIMDGLVNTGTTLLEPILRFRITTPREMEGKVLGDLAQMRAVYDTPTNIGDRSLIEGEIPAATSLHYPIALGALTGGRGVMTSHFLVYRECPPDVEASRTRRGVNPLDRAKYILAARSALQ